MNKHQRAIIRLGREFRTVGFANGAEGAIEWAIADHKGDPAAPRLLETFLGEFRMACTAQGHSEFTQHPDFVEAAKFEARHAAALSPWAKLAA